MISNNKILTVSYGTFSCTLEGFDDSFGTMKAIAEYFRDLAAEDRYFGAEPPTPDAEMLARIAEREIARRVQAREDGGKIILRAEETAPTTYLTGTGEAEKVTPKEASFTAPQPAAPVPGASAPEPQSNQPEAKVTEPDEMAATDPAQTRDPEEEVLAPETASTDEEPGEATEDTTLSDPPLEDGDASEDDAPATSAETQSWQAEDTADISHPDPESVAAKLRRIRSVVAQTPVEDAADYSEDEHAQDFLNAAAADLDAALVEDDRIALRDEASALEEDGDIDDLADALTNAAPEGAGLDAGERPEVEETAEEEIPDEVSTPEVIEAGSEPDTELEDTLAQLLADAMPATAAQDEAPEAADGDQEERPLDARVIKVKRADLDQVLEPGEIAEDDEATSPEENLFSEEDTIKGDDLPESTLSPEEEAELQRELAALEAEFSTDEDGDPAGDLAGTDEALKTDDDDDFGYDDPEDMDASDDEDDFSEPSGHHARGVETLQRVKRDSDLTRIFDEADTQLEEPDSSKRRNAIQHLRAAVAATRAEKRAGADMARNVDDSPYRSDLADVVRPRRPSSAGASRSERPAGDRPAPLKLVAEQRIDTPREPVRPRRVHTQDLGVEHGVPSDGSSFAEYVETVGAGSLPELLEAAAAYMADVEGRPQFSRPMLMGKLREVEGDAFSREDGLRSFGQLLRQGKLQKLNGGRFAVTDETDFRAPKRNVG